MELKEYVEIGKIPDHRFHEISGSLVALGTGNYNIEVIGENGNGNQVVVEIYETLYDQKDTNIDVKKLLGRIEEINELEKIGGE